MLTLSKFGINERHASLSPCWWFCRSASSPLKSKSTWDAICCWQHGHLCRSRVKFSTIVHGLASINIWLQPRQQLWNSPCIWDALNFSACLKFSSRRITNNSLYWEGRIAMGNGPNGVRTDWYGHQHWGQRNEMSVWTWSILFRSITCRGAEECYFLLTYEGC